MLDRVVQPAVIQFRLGNDVIGSVDNPEWIAPVLDTSICALAPQDDGRASGQLLRMPANWPVTAEHTVLPVVRIVTAQSLAVFQ